MAEYGSSFKFEDIAYLAVVTVGSKFLLSGHSDFALTILYLPKRVVDSLSSLAQQHARRS